MSQDSLRKSGASGATAPEGSPAAAGGQWSTAKPCSRNWLRERLDRIKEQNPQTVTVPSTSSAAPASGVALDMPAMVRVGYWGTSPICADKVASKSKVGDFARPWLRRKLEPVGRERREIENRACAGGMRSPWKGAASLPAHRQVGKNIKHAIFKFLEADPKIIEDLLNLKEVGFKMHVDRIEKVLLPMVAKVLNTEDLARGPRSRWRAGIVEAYVKASGDQEVHLADWLRHGAPTGVAREIPTCGIFPPTDRRTGADEDMQRIFAKTEEHRNYSSVSEHREAVQTELDRLTAQGFMTKYDSWADLMKEFRQVVVSRMACIVKEKDDGSVKLRLITDMLRSKVNMFVKLGERIVLPRLWDVVEATLKLLAARPNNTSDDWDAEMLISDFADAFHSMGVHVDERRHQVVAGMKGDFRVYESVVFGGGGSPLVWGRGAAFLGRSGQSLFDPTEMAMEIFVDDPWTVWSGSRSTRRRNMVALLLWWIIIGLDLAWQKLQVGKDLYNKTQTKGGRRRVMCGPSFVCTPGGGVFVNTNEWGATPSHVRPLLRLGSGGGFCSNAQNTQEYGAGEAVSRVCGPALPCPVTLAPFAPAGLPARAKTFRRTLFPATAPLKCFRASPRSPRRTSRGLELEWRSRAPRPSRSPSRRSTATIWLRRRAHCWPPGP